MILGGERAHLEWDAGTRGDSNTTGEFYNDGQSYNNTIAEFYSNTIAELYHNAEPCPNGRGAFCHGGGGGADRFISASMLIRFDCRTVAFLSPICGCDRRTMATMIVELWLCLVAGN